MLQACRGFRLRPTLVPRRSPRVDFVGRQRRCSAEFTANVVAQEVVYLNQGLVRRIVTFPKRKPFWFSFWLNATVMGGADLHTQFIEGRRLGSIKPERQLDWRRTGMFSLFGAVQAVTSWYVYIRLFKVVFPGALPFANKPWRLKLTDFKGQVDVVKQALADVFVYTPFCFYPNFYLFQVILRGECKAPGDVFQSALLRYRENCVADNAASTAMWLPADLVVFAVPAWLRLPTTYGFNYVFIALLSFFRGGERPNTKA